MTGSLIMTTKVTMMKKLMHDEAKHVMMGNAKLMQLSPYELQRHDHRHHHQQEVKQDHKPSVVINIPRSSSAQRLHAQDKK